ncbi:hypothetical protein FC82_GL001876 [Secundilactobacillus collinoides DSM 20515 = JCM 1123]|uniref:Uncharacterized protein n=1 Tax=Secundilactobacillus collinoides DSM 20515 = JCM 1123 TaxID=1423733 RepID=A0A0R2BKN9_SECCO|nr:hypothetical protein FC82_GL001876 [Secundilactobacillus collinoides DSM 20515 = JCM 1123]
MPIVHAYVLLEMCFIGDSFVLIIFARARQFSDTYETGTNAKNFMKSEDFP